MQGPPLAVSKSSLRADTWQTSRTALPEEDGAALRQLALSAGWNLQMLKAPPYSPRKCPVLPRFIPQSTPHGLSYAADASQDGRFHGFAKVSEQQTPPRPDADKCPYGH